MPEPQGLDPSQGFEPSQAFFCVPLAGSRADIGGNDRPAGLYSSG